MLSSEVLLQSIQSAPSGLNIAGIMTRHPELARRTTQLWLNEPDLTPRAVAKQLRKLKWPLLTLLKNELDQNA